MRQHREDKGPRFLQRQLILGRRRRAVRALRTHVVESARASALRHNAPRTAAALSSSRVFPSALARLFRSPWLFIGIALAGLILALISTGSLTGLMIAPSHPALPAPADVDPALYSLMVPAQTARPAGDVNPVLLNSLKVTQYTTQAGDNLSRIAARFKLNVDTLVSFNDITDARGVATGSTLDIPNSDGLKYTVRRGDTLQGIARNAGVDFNGVLDWNGLTSSVIRSGQ